MHQRLHVLVHPHQLIHTRAALVARHAALRAAHGVPARLAVFGVFTLLLAMRAQLAHQPLRQHAEQAAGEKERLDTHVDEASDAARRVVRVHRRQHQVAGQAGLDGDAGGFIVADLTDHDDVRVLPKDRAQRLGERQIDLRVHLRLPNAGQFVLHRVLDGQHVGGSGVHAAQAGVKRRRLARTRGPCDEHDAVRLLNEPRIAAQRLAVHAQAFQRELRFRLVQQAQHGAFAVRRRQCADAHVDGAAADAQGNAAVLWQALFGDVELGHDLQPADQRRMQRLVGLHHLAQRAVDTETHAAAAFIGFDVDVACAVFRGLRQQRVQHADDGRVVGRFQQVFHRRQFLHHAR